MDILPSQVNNSFASFCDYDSSQYCASQYSRNIMRLAVCSWNPSRGDRNVPWPAPIDKDSTHDAVHHGYYLGCHARMLHVFPLFPLDGFGSAVPSFQLHPVFGIDTERVPPNDAMSRFVGFGDKSWDNLKNFFQTQGFEFLFLSQSARRVAFGGSMAPKTPVLKLNRPFARKPPAAIASELTRVACAPFAKPQVAGLRHS